MELAEFICYVAFFVLLTATTGAAIAEIILLLIKNRGKNNKR